MKSLSEIEITAKRASKAAGYSWGVSEEIGKSVRLLEFFIYPFEDNPFFKQNAEKSLKSD